MAENQEFQNCKKLIYLYIKSGKINYGKEIKLAKKLLELYPIEFYESYFPTSIVTSLTIFLTQAGLKELKNQFALFQAANPPKPVKLEESPQIELNFVKAPAKPKTIMEFVDEKNE